VSQARASTSGAEACLALLVNVVRTGGVEITYERVGEGPPLVFVHGAGEDGRVWQPQLAALADEFTVVAWDEPGAGRSSDVPADFGLTEYANCLAALIEALELGPAHVAGISWGGTVVLKLYRHHSELVATLILADTYAGWKGSLSEEELRARVESVHRMLAAPAEDFDPTLSDLFVGDPAAEFASLLADMAADMRPESFRVALLVMAEADQSDLLPRYRADLADLGRAGRAVTAQRRTPVRAGDPRCATRRDPQGGTRQQPRTTRRVQRCRARVLSRPLAAADLTAPYAPLALL